jgi:mono/diheme cytochrome c family protein
MRRTCITLLGIVALASSGMAAEISPRALVEGYCVTCHNEQAKRGGLVLDPTAAAHPEEQPELWEKVVRKLRSGTMPPAGARRPDRAQITSAVASLEGVLDQAAVKTPNPGRVVLQRLNRAEYVNAIRDLLALDIDARETLPADDSGYGFDNIADVLTLSPGLFDRYLSAARRIARDAIGDPTTVRPVITTLVRIPMFRVQSDRMGEELPFGSRGGAAVRHHFALDGEYVLRINFQRGTMSGVIRGLQDDNEVDLRVDGQRVKLFLLEKRKGATAGYSDGTGQEPLEVRVPLKAGPHTVAVSLRKVTTAYEGWGPVSMPVASNSFAQTDRMTPESGRVEVAVEYIEVEGPFNVLAPTKTPSRDRIFACRPANPADETCATRILSKLAYRAYRQPVSKDQIGTLMQFYRDGRGDDRSFERGIQFALERILIDPAFLFRAERIAPAQSGTALQPIDDFTLASKLSFFLWSSIPDDALLQAAAQGTLHQPAVLERQVRRMLADERAHALVENFFGQWLMLRNMSSLDRDQTVYPTFDDNLRHDLQTETEMFLGSQLREDRPAAELLTANYSFINERLAEHYGIKGIYGSHFRRVTLTDPNRAGLLGQGSILAVTSYANRTSPVLRGKWLMQNILGTPPPPPPANVPPLDATQVQGTLRQRMEQHRKNPVCAGCHSQLDPLGFALENFDAIGRWRSTDAKQPIDASGSLPDGSKFSGPESFRAALLPRREQFVATLTERLLTYALGRGVEYYDLPAVRSIMREAAGADYRWSVIISGIVRSVPFRMRRAS